MKPDSPSLSGRVQLWIAASIILLAVVIGVVTLLDVWRAAPETSVPTTTLNTLSATNLAAASAVPTLTSTATSPPPPTATSTPIPTPLATRQAGATPPVVRAKIEIVWPHNDASTRDADLANITVYLISGNGISGGAALEAPPCDWTPIVRLWGALNNQPVREIAVGSKRMVSSGGRTYPVWDFNDISVAEARDPANKLTFFVTVDGVTTLTNVWAHASDARTIFSQTDVPTGALDVPSPAVDARIQIVWPHDDRPIAEADRVNVTAYLFAAETLQSFAPDVAWKPTVRLHWSINNEPERVGSAILGRPRVLTTGTGLQFLAWDFNDVDVSAARDPLNRLYLWVTVDDVTTYSNIWGHGADARTIFPQLDILNSCR